MRNNFEYTKTLAEWALARRARFTYASSAATYGDGEAGMNDQEEDLSRFRPLNMYGYSKHLFDQYARRAGIWRSIIGLKYFNILRAKRGSQRRHAERRPQGLRADPGDREGAALQELPARLQPR